MCDNEAFASLHQFYNLQTLQVEDCIILVEKPTPSYKGGRISLAPKQICKFFAPVRKFGWLGILDSNSIRFFHIDIAQPDSDDYILGFHVPCCCGCCILSRIISFPSALEELRTIPPQLASLDPMVQGTRFCHRSGHVLSPAATEKSVTLRGLVGNFGIHPWQDVLNCTQEQAESI